VRRIVVGISGASGAVFGVKALELIRAADGWESHLVVSASGATTLRHELDMSVADLATLADVHHRRTDIGASIASGSFAVDGMLVAPCSIKTLSAIAHCYSDSLLTRAADVCLKERRPLVLMVRETPLHAGHIRLLGAVAEAGAVVYPPVPAFYNAPRSIDDLVRYTVTRALAQIDRSLGPVAEWGGLAGPRLTPEGRAIVA
jgi:4-hydroxy-3-polyprenylbenzoate decarboxylase